MSNVSAVALFRKRLRGANRIVWSAEDVSRIAKKCGLTDRAVQSVLPALPSVKDFVFRADANASDFDFSCTISTSSVDRMGDTIAVAGWKLDSYRRNPVVLFSHESGELPIGRCPAVWMEGSRLRANVKLAGAIANPVAAQVRELVAGRFLSATSVGFKPLEWSFTNDPKRPLGVDFKRAELLEFSLVVVPANSEAVIDIAPFAIAAGKTGQSDIAGRRQREFERLKREGHRR